VTIATSSAIAALDTAIRTTPIMMAFIAVSFERLGSASFRTKSQPIQVQIYAPADSLSLNKSRAMGVSCNRNPAMPETTAH
jgi:hypothetical protein